MQIVGENPVVSDRIREWHLKIPKEFRISQHRNWEVSPPFYLEKNRGSGNHSGLSILADLSNTGKIVPLTNPRAKNLVSVFSITLKNALVHTRFLSKEFCVPEWEYSTVDTPKACREKVNCSINFNYFGWPVRVALRNEFAFEYPKYCYLARKQLDAWTVGIDDLRNP